MKPQGSGVNIQKYLSCHHLDIDQTFHPSDICRKDLRSQKVATAPSDEKKEMNDHLRYDG